MKLGSAIELRISGLVDEDQARSDEAMPVRLEAPPDPLSDLKSRIQSRLLQQLDITKLNGRCRAELQGVVGQAVGTLLREEDVVLSRQERQQVITDIADEVLGLGPLEPLLQDPTISEVMVNRPNQIYIERRGIISLSEKSFRDEAHIMRIIDRIISPLGRRVDESSPMVDARLADGSRVHIVIPPVALDSPTITIRKFAKDPFTVEDLIGFGTLSAEMAEFFRLCVMAKLNVLVSGGTGTGKTTFLNVLSSFIPWRERVVTIEDPAELQLRQPHVVRLETRPPNIEGKGQIVQRDLVRNALRMRPDRIIVGEVRGGEAFDMLQAMNTGHEGSLSTVHANTPRDALSRVENMVLMAGLDLPIKAIRDQMASAVQLIIHLNRLQDGTRRVTKVTEVVGMEGQIITLQDIFEFQQQGLDEDGKVLGRMRATGLRPKFAEKFERLGVPLPVGLFKAA
ncbi:MAG: CpaF family protein [Dehalococcoidia bacterium]|nr:CpaF family protein [Dehalococcoidia bacterium]